MKFHLLDLILALGLLAVSARTGAETVGARFLNAVPSVRQFGLGGASLGGADLLRGWSNPALLADLQNSGEAAFSGTTWFDGLQSSFAGGGGGLINPDWGAALMYQGEQSSLDEVDSLGRPTGASLKRAFSCLDLATGLRWGWLRAGLAAKTLSDQAASDQASALAADLGAAAEWKYLALAAAIRNLGPDLRPASDALEAEELPLQWRVGMELRLGRVGLKAVGEYVAETGLPGETDAGLEWWPWDGFGFRLGCGNAASDTRQYRAGFSAVLGGLGLDYAVGTNTLGMIQQAALSYCFGPGPAERLAAEGPGPKVLKRYLEALQALSDTGPSDEDFRLRSALLDLVRRAGSRPPLPAEAARDFRQGAELASQAQNEDQAAESAKLLEDGLRLAPWDAQAYYWDGAAREMAGYTQRAVSAYKLYLLAAPDAPDTGKVRGIIADLEKTLGEEP